MANVFDLARRYRKRVLDAEGATVRPLIERYGQAYLALTEESSRFHGKMLARAAELGVPIEQISQTDPSWPFRQGNLDAHRAAIAKRMADLASSGNVATEQLQGMGVRMGLDHAKDLTGEAVAQKVVGRKAQEAARTAIRGVWDRPNTEAIEALIGLTADGTPLAELFSRAALTSADEMTGALIQGFTLGQGPREIAAVLKKSLGGNLTRALRIARTETIRSYRLANQVAFQANPEIVTGWYWHSALDARTCVACIERHGSFHQVEEILSDHVQGRCAMVPGTPPWKELAQRHGLDIGDVDEAVPVVKTGADWLAEQAPAVQQKILGASRFDLYRKGTHLDEMVARVNDPVWGSSVRVRSIAETGKPLVTKPTVQKPLEVTPPPTPAEALRARIAELEETIGDPKAFDRKPIAKVDRTGGGVRLIDTGEEIGFVRRVNAPSGGGYWKALKRDARPDGRPGPLRDVTSAKGIGHGQRWGAVRDLEDAHLEDLRNQLRELDAPTVDRSGFVIQVSEDSPAWVREVADEVGEGLTDHDHAIRAGAIVERELTAQVREAVEGARITVDGRSLTLADEMDRLKKEVDAATDRVSDARVKMNQLVGGRTTEEGERAWRAAREAYFDAITGVSEARARVLKLGALEDDIRQRVAKDVIGQVRATDAALQNWAKGGNAAVKKAVDDDIADLFPSSWLQASASRNAMKTGKVQRGFYRDRDWSRKQGYTGESALKISGEPGTHDFLDTVAHEMGHRMEYTVTGVRKRVFQTPGGPAIAEVPEAAWDETKAIVFILEKYDRVKLRATLDDLIDQGHLNATQADQIVDAKVGGFLDMSFQPIKPGIRDLEAALYDDWTRGVAGKRKDGGIFRGTRADLPDWPLEYAGKKYPDDRAYEIFTTGMEAVRGAGVYRYGTQRIDYQGSNPDLYRFVLGVLVGVP